MKAFLLFTVIVFVSLNTVVKSQSQADDCIKEINGTLKGQPGNVQDNMFHSLAIDPMNEKIIYVGTESNGIFKTSDGGSTWIRLRKGLKCTAQQNVYPQIFDITIDPANTQTLYASTVNGPGPEGDPTYLSASGGIYKSTDGGVTWVRKQTEFSNTYTTYVLVDPNNSKRLFAGISGVRSSFPKTKDVFFTGGLLMSEDGGDSWHPLQLPKNPSGLDSNTFSTMRIVSSALQSIVYATGEIHKTDVGSPSAGLLRSSDKGATWLAINPQGKTIKDFDAFEGNGNIIYANDSETRKLYKSSDGGSTWSLLSGGSNSFGPIRIAPNSPQTVFYVGGGTQIFKSTDGLTTAKLGLDTKSSDNQITDLKIAKSNPDYVYALAKGYYIYKSVDGGVSFTRLSGVRDSVYSGAMVSVQRHSDIHANQSFMLHPNPSSDHFNIRISLTIPEHITLKLFNTLGQEIAQILDVELSAGEHSQSLDINRWSLVSGIYFVQLKTQHSTPNIIPLQVLR